MFKARNHYLLVVVDYGTRLPNGFLLKSIDTETILDILIPLFGSVGFPDEVLTDSGSNFIGKLMQEFHKLVGVIAIRTSSCHPQTDGLVKWFNTNITATLKK